MFFSICALALSLSIDALGVGISYGLRKVKIPLLSASCICMFSILYSGISIRFGKYLSTIIPQQVSKLIGIFILMFMGCFIIVQGLFNKNNSSKNNGNKCINNKVKCSNCWEKHKNYIQKTNAKDETLLKIVIKSFGITIQVLRNPSECDIDKSGIIDLKESLLLGLALSVDAIGVGVGSGLSGFHSMLIPFAVGIFQLALLRIGTYLAYKILNIGKISGKFIAIVPGILLIILAIIRI